MTTLRIFNQYVPSGFLLLALIEGLAVIAAVYLGIELRYLQNPPEQIAQYVGDTLPKALFMALAIVSALASMGLYQRRSRVRRDGKLVRILIAFALAAAFISMAYYLLRYLTLWRGALVIALILSFVFILVIRKIFYDLAQQETLKRRILVLGSGKRANTINQLRRYTDRRGFAIVGFVGLADENNTVSDHRLIKKEKKLIEIVDQYQVDEVVLAMDDRRHGLPLDELLDCKMTGVDVIEIQDFFERETGKVKLDILRPSWLIFSHGFDQNWFNLHAKRIFDIAVSITLLTLTLPIMLLTALVIKSQDGGPVFFRQIRVGKDGLLFNIVKFRSMRMDAEKDGKARWATRNDDRVTGFGRFIRKTRIDELPQLWNVIRGEMSFVGPRPERPEFVDKLSESIPFYTERHRVKPGITGWAQICYPYGANERDALEKLQFDLYYAKNHNLMLDLVILFQTVEVIIFGQGAR